MLLLNKQRCLFFSKTHFLSGAIWIGHSVLQNEFENVGLKSVWQHWFSSQCCGPAPVHVLWNDGSHEPLTPTPTYAAACLFRTVCSGKGLVPWPTRGQGHGTTFYWGVNVQPHVFLIHSRLDHSVNCWSPGSQDDGWTDCFLLRHISSGPELSTGNRDSKDRALVLMMLTSDKAERNQNRQKLHTSKPWDSNPAVEG